MADSSLIAYWGLYASRQCGTCEKGTPAEVAISAHIARLRGSCRARSAPAASVSVLPIDQAGQLLLVHHSGHHNGWLCSVAPSSAAAGCVCCGCGCAPGATDAPCASCLPVLAPAPQPQTTGMLRRRCWGSSNASPMPRTAGRPGVHRRRGLAGRMGGYTGQASRAGAAVWRRRRRRFLVRCRVAKTPVHAAAPLLLCTKGNSAACCG